MLLNDNCDIFLFKYLSLKNNFVLKYLKTSHKLNINKIKISIILRNIGVILKNCADFVFVFSIGKKFF